MKFLAISIAIVLFFAAALYAATQIIATISQALP